MTDQMIQKEFRCQLRIIKKKLAKMSGFCKPKALHRLRSAMLRMTVLLKYIAHSENKGLGRRLMKCRKAMAACRDLDVCWQRVKGEMHSAGFSKKARHRIRKAIHERRSKAQRKMQRMLHAQKFEELLADIDNVVDSPGKLDLTAIHQDNIIYQRPNEWKPGQFHEIRKRLRIINYVHDLVVEKEHEDVQQDNDNWILRYQSVLGDYIDGSNSVGILSGLTNVKQRWIEGLIDREVGKMQKCRWLIKSMPWPDTVNFSRTAFQESCL